MATFLTTRKMDPALAARIDASVRGQRAKPGGSAFAPRVISFVRILSIVAIAAAASFFVIVRNRDRAALERSRAALLSTVRAHASSLSAEDTHAVARAESWLTRASGAYEGDLVASELQAPGAFAALLTRSAIYARGPLTAFTSTAGIAETAAASRKDAFLLCLVEPPATRAEKGLLAKVRAAYYGGALTDQRTASVHRLGAAAVGLPLLTPPWIARVQAAQDSRDIARLERDFERAPIEEAKKAATAGLLLFAMDEPGTGQGPTELDGERVHDVRIGIVDLAASKVLLRLRKRVDPSWISVQARAEYASGLDSCLLALDVHASTIAGTRALP